MQKKNPGTLIKKYSIFSFVLLCCIISAYQSVIFIHTWIQHNDAHTVNVAGRQRMLSQRIGKNLLLSLKANSEKNRQDFFALTLADINTLSNNHTQLERNLLTSTLSKSNCNIRADFAAIKQPLLQMILAVNAIDKINRLNGFSSENQQNITQFSNLYFAHEETFLNLMDDIVKCYETELQKYVSQLRSLSWVGAGFILLIMFINGRFVVYKSIKEVDEQFLEIKNHKDFQDIILSSCLEGIVTINANSCITLMNKTAEKLFSGLEQEFLGKRITSIIPNFEADYLESMQERYEMELEGRKKGAVLFPILINISKIEASNRQGWIIFIKDLSVKKKIEKELIFAKQSVMEAVEANNAKSKFVANISHELKTPLNSIIGFSQLLQSDKDSPLIAEHAEYIGYINQAGSHLLSLINEILDLAKLESGQLSVSLEIVNISAIVKEAVILIYALANKKHIKISNDFDSMPDCYIVVDKVRIKQVLLNLLSNAVKYNINNGSIIISAENKNNQSLKISVTDSGWGIPENKLSQLFDPFNRLGAENSEIEGTGIGLTITKNLVEDMGGKIGVLSEESKGSTFWVEFPLAENHQAIENIQLLAA
jgi:PAS domain S-box-containing protein